MTIKPADGPTNMRSPNRDGLTLMELLVVVAILGMLAALLLTAISQAKSRAQCIQCANNVRQLGQAMQEYITDHHAYPLFCDPHAGNLPEDFSWVTAIQLGEFSGGKMDSYMNTNGSRGVPFFHQGVWLCPSAIRPSIFDKEGEYNKFVEDVSYGYNACGLSFQTDTNLLGLGGHYSSNSDRPGLISFHHPVGESEIADPSEMLALGDGLLGGSNQLYEGSLFFERTDRQPKYPVFGSTQTAYARHRGKANVVFCDGHVESPSLPFLFADAGDPALVRWNRDHQPHRELLQP